MPFCGFWVGNNSGFMVCRNKTSSIKEQQFFLSWNAWTIILSADTSVMKSKTPCLLVIKQVYIWETAFHRKMQKIHSKIPFPYDSPNFLRGNRTDPHHTNPVWLFWPLRAQEKMWTGQWQKTEGYGLTESRGKSSEVHLISLDVTPIFKSCNREAWNFRSLTTLWRQAAF